MVFFKVKTTEEVLELVQGFQPVGEEIVPLDSAFGRVLSKDIVAPEDLPGFARTSVDGYAIRAKDSFGATENLPALLEIVGEVGMGQIPAVTVGAGQAVRISTGGMVPKGADGVVMVEYCHLMDQTTLEVSRAISPQENVIQPDDDFKKGAAVRRKGWRLRSQDVGVLAGLGVTEVPVHRKPRVAIISTGDEVVPVQARPNLGQVRDINTYTLSAFSREEGAEPVPLGLCRDDFEQLRNLLLKGLDAADTVWISGGSSVGTRDLTLKVFESIEGTELLVHGISISPGKPTIIARKGAAAIFGLPGHTASAMVVAEVFLAPFLERLGGETTFGEKVKNQVAAKLSRNIESASGRDDFIRVRLSRKDGVWIAEPIFGKSGLISTLVEADGLLRIDRNTEGLYEGQEVEVMRFKTA
jgi:molybdopterin molybdotransferase